MFRFEWKNQLLLSRKNPTTEANVSFFRRVCRGGRRVEREFIEFIDELSLPV
jgi:hypothetical protein